MDELGLNVLQAELNEDSQALGLIMAGELTVESEYGKGSTFTVCLPLAVGEGTMK